MGSGNFGAVRRSSVGKVWRHGAKDGESEARRRKRGKTGAAISMHNENSEGQSGHESRRRDAARRSVSHGLSVNVEEGTQGACSRVCCVLKSLLCVKESVVSG